MINLTAETMQTNIPLTWTPTLLNRSRMVLLYTKNEHFLGTHVQYLHSNNVKQNTIRLEKQNFIN